jgi:hypothetical protein
MKNRFRCQNALLNLLAVSLAMTPSTGVAMSRFEAAAMVKDFGQALGCTLELPTGDKVWVEIATSDWQKQNGRKSCAATSTASPEQPPLDAMRFIWADNHLTMQAGINHSLIPGGKKTSPADAPTRRAWVEMASAKFASPKIARGKSFWSEYDGFYLCRSWGEPLTRSEISAFVVALRREHATWSERILPEARWHIEHDKLDKSVQKKRLRIDVMASDFRDEIFSCLQNQRVPRSP